MEKLHRRGEHDERWESMRLLAHKALPYLKPLLNYISFRQVSHLQLRGLADAAWLSGDKLSQLGIFAVTLLPIIDETFILSTCTSQPPST